MRGIVLAYERESGAGLIRGEDGNRYGFRGQDWRERTAPLKGVSVDFEPDGPLARDIYIIMPADGAGDREPVSFLVAIRSWILSHPEALVACLILVACGLPFYRFLGIETTLYQAPEILLRLSSGLERIRALAQQVPSAATAAAMIKMLLPGIYVLWIIPVLAAYVLYRALFDLPRLGLLRLLGLCALLLPVLIPLMVVVPTWFLVVQSIPAEQQITLAHSVFDLPRFGPLREIALGAVATMILGLGLFLWSINPDNTGDHAAARQGTTHRSGRSRGRQRLPGEPVGRGASDAPAAHPAGTAPGTAEAFVPPRLRSRGAPEHPGAPPGYGQHPPDSLRPMPPGSQPGPQPPHHAAPEPPPAQPYPGQPPHHGAAPDAPVPAAPGPAGAGFGYDEGLPHHDPIPESLRRRFEERQQRLAQTPPDAAPAQPQNEMPALLPPEASEATGAPEAYDELSQDPSGPAAGSDPAGGAPPGHAAHPQLPDARDGFGVPVNASVSGWSVDPGRPRYDFGGGETARPATQPAPHPAETGDAAEQPYASLAQQLRLTPGGGPANPLPAPPAGSNGPAPDQIPVALRPAEPPKTLEALAAGARSRPQPPPEPETQVPETQVNTGAAGALPPPQQQQDAEPADESQSDPAPEPVELADRPAELADRPAERTDKPAVPPPPKEITDFLRLLDEPDGLRKLAAIAPSSPKASPNIPPAGAPIDASESAASRPPSGTAVPSGESQSLPPPPPPPPPAKPSDQPPSRGNGVAPPPPPPPDETLEHALDRAMERLNGSKPGHREKPAGEDTETPPAATSDAAKTVTALYERLRQERRAKEPKSGPPIPPVPPRR